MRADGRTANEIRPLTLETGFISYPEGSVLYRAGGTLVLCNVSLTDRIPGFLRGTGEGWVTAEYAMLPRATDTRSDREVNKGRPSGRSQEIQRLIGRSLRAGIKRGLMGERTLTADCDVLQADGSTRCASISGAWTAMVLALAKMYGQGLLPEWPISHQVAGISVGLIGDQAIVDLDYGEDFDCDVDLNLVFTGDGRLIEVQGTAEGEPFSPDQFHTLLKSGWIGAQAIMKAQLEAVGPALQDAGVEMGA
ncbi:MAG: ribonuclease PH [Acidobacteria bacterium]|nr:MAG: ribonuclease PH [Acidobacteriota bacterium]